MKKYTVLVMALALGMSGSLAAKSLGERVVGRVVKKQYKPERDAAMVKYKAAQADIKAAEKEYKAAVKSYKKVIKKGGTKADQATYLTAAQTAQQNKLPLIKDALDALLAYFNAHGSEQKQKDYYDKLLEQGEDVQADIKGLTKAIKGLTKS